MKFNIDDRVLYRRQDSLAKDTGTVVAPKTGLPGPYADTAVWVKWDSDSKVLWALPQNLVLIDHGPNPVAEWSAWDDFLLTNSDSMKTLPTKTLALIKAGFFAEQGHGQAKLE